MSETTDSRYYTVHCTELREKRKKKKKENYAKNLHVVIFFKYLRELHSLEQC